MSCGPLDETNENVLFFNQQLHLGRINNFISVYERADIFTSRCFRDASWVPDPISQCAVDGERGISHKSQTLAITGSLFGVLAVIMLILLAVVGILIFFKKGAQNLYQYILDPKFEYLCRLTLETIQKEYGVSKFIIIIVIIIVIIIQAYIIPMVFHNFISHETIGLML